MDQQEGRTLGLGWSTPHGTDPMPVEMPVVVLRERRNRARVWRAGVRQRNRLGWAGGAGHGRGDGERDRASGPREVDAKESHRSAALMFLASLYGFAALSAWSDGAPEPMAWSLMLPLRDWLPGSALWALALYLPLSLPLAALERRLESGTLAPLLQQLLLAGLALALALGGGTLLQLLLGWALGPAWAGSLALVVALWGLFWGLASRQEER